MEISITDFTDTVPIYNSGTVLFNELWDFIKLHNMDDYSILDCIEEFSFKNNYNPLEVCEILSDYEGFKQLVTDNLKKHKYIKNNTIEHEWEGINDEGD